MSIEPTHPFQNAVAAALLVFAVVLLVDLVRKPPAASPAVVVAEPRIEYLRPDQVRVVKAYEDRMPEGAPPSKICRGACYAFFSVY